MVTESVIVDLSGLPTPVADSIKQLVASLRGAHAAVSPSANSRSVIGLFADQGVPTPSLEELQDARREAWAGFPRDVPEADRS